MPADDCGAIFEEPIVPWALTGASVATEQRYRLRKTMEPML